MFNFPFSLQRFAEGDGAASSPSTPDGNSASVGANVTGNGGTDGQTAGGATESAADRRKRYEAAKQEFKDLYDVDVSSQVKRRHKDYTDVKKKADAQDEFLSLLHVRYGTKTLEELKSAVDADEFYWREAADKADMTVEQYKDHIRMKTELARSTEELEAIRYQERARAFANEQYKKWTAEAEEVKAKYPEFDLDEALQNEQFRSMLSAKYQGYMPTMTQIYEMLYRDSIMSKVVEDTKKGVVDSIRARGQRPNEAGSGTSGGIDTKIDVSKLTPKERAEILKRVQMGEIITFT